MDWLEGDPLDEAVDDVLLREIPPRMRRALAAVVQAGHRIRLVRAAVLQGVRSTGADASHPVYLMAWAWLDYCERALVSGEMSCRLR